jgi:DNA-dependent RNA polymerase auxiliary subunit epsilon
MEFKLNKSAREETINRLFEKQIQQIQNNLDRGERTTELYIDKEFSSEVRDKLEVAFEGKNLSFQIVRRSPNEYTGRMQHFTSELRGDERYYKVYYSGE